MNRPRPGVLLTAASAMVRVSRRLREHADHEFARAIDCPPHRRSLPTGSAAKTGASMATLVPRHTLTTPTG